MTTRTTIRKWLVFGLMAGTIVSVGMVSYSLGGLFTEQSVRDQAEVRPTVGGLYVDPTSLALGEVQETATYPLRLELRNTSSQRKRVIDIRGSCGCTAIEPRELVIPPGGTGSVTLSIDLSERGVIPSGISRRPFSVRVDPLFAGDLNPTPGWLVTAEVVSVVTVDVARLGFAEGHVHQSGVVPRRVRVETHTPLSGLQAEVVPPNAGTATLVPTAAGRYDLMIAPSLSLPVGPFRFAVQVRPTATDGTPLVVIPVEVLGEMLPTVRAFPRTIIIGEIDTPGTAEAEVVLTVPLGESWRVGTISSDAEGTKVTAVGSAPDGGVRYRVEQPGTKVGDQQVVVTFAVLGPDERKETVRVELRYHGRAR